MNSFIEAIYNSGGIVTGLYNGIPFEAVIVDSRVKAGTDIQSQLEFANATPQRYGIVNGTTLMQGEGQGYENLKVRLN
jgi:hypothetical protein